MQIIKPWALFLAIALIFSGCNSGVQQQEITTADPELDDVPVETEGDEYWARENFDLQRVGDLVERAGSPEEFEALLNDEGGVNNLDLNGDGYVDYVSVDEFDGRDRNARGLSLFSRFGPDMIQEIATILFYRDDLNSPGARVLLIGNEQIYGDDNYYETDWLERSLPLVSDLFEDRDDPYRSQYFYENYPANYDPFEIVDPPAYRTRMAELMSQPSFVPITTVPVYASKVKIKSPHNGKWMEKIHAKLAKPTKEQVDFISADPGRTRFLIDEHGRQRDDDVRGDARTNATDDLDGERSGKRPDDFRRNADARHERKGRGRDDFGREDRGGSKDDKSGHDAKGKDKEGTGGAKKSN
jgi:hypothetical protein